MLAIAESALWHPLRAARSLLDIRGNVLRGREHNEDANIVSYVDEFRMVKNLITNQVIHGPLPSLIADTPGEMI